MSSNLMENRLFGCNIRNTYIMRKYTHRLQLIFFGAALPPASKVFISSFLTLSQGSFRSLRFLLLTGQFLQACAFGMMHVSTLPKLRSHIQVHRR